MIPQAALEKFSRIIREVEEIFPGSRPVIGGGALRDAYHGRQIKDVDVFIRANYPDLYSPFTKLVIPSHCTYAWGRSDMHGVWDVTFPIEGFFVQLILADFNTLEDLAPTFDLGICRITYDGSCLFLHQDFYEDARAKVFRVRRADNASDAERAEKRITRLLQKYPDFTVHPLDWT